MADQVFIQHRFTINKDGYPPYTDAIVLPESEYKKLSPVQIETQKNQRFDNWKNLIDNPPVVPEPSKEEQLAQVEKDLASIEEQKTVLLSQKTELEKVSVKKGK